MNKIDEESKGFLQDPRLADVEKSVQSFKIKNFRIHKREEDLNWSSESRKSSGSRNQIRLSNSAERKKIDLTVRESSTSKQSPNVPRSSKHLVLLKQKYNEIKAQAVKEDLNLTSSLRQSTNLLKRKEHILIESGS
jgi:hypothetical protein